MDLNTIDPVSVDVAHVVSNLSFRFYSDAEALRLSILRLTAPAAFDELGAPTPNGLYDPRLGPTSIADGPCKTCGLSYSTCPGHFGHIQLPVPLPHPLLTKTIIKILKSSCWTCPCLLGSPEDLNLLLARLYFEDAALPDCGLAVEAFRVLRRRGMTRKEVNAIDTPDEEVINGTFVKNWKKFFDGSPPALAEYTKDLGNNDLNLAEKRYLQAAKVAWKKAQTNGTLAQHRSKGWNEAFAQLFSANAGECSVCLRGGSHVRLGDRGRLFRKYSGGEVLVAPLQIYNHIKGLWAVHEELFELAFGLKGRKVDKLEENPGHMRLFVKIVLVPPPRFRPSSKMDTMEFAAEHPQNLFFQRLLTEIEIILTANEYGLEEGGGTMQVEGDEAPMIERPTKARFALAMSNMQEALRDLYDSAGTFPGGKVQMTGIRQQLESKQGLFRQHIMGKRVNFSCRSVIGPDVFLDPSEVGIPESFAKLLTVPEPVSQMNLAEMQRAVRNGPNTYPGANAIEDWIDTNSTSRVVRISAGNEHKRIAQASLLLQNRSEKTKRKNGYSPSKPASEQPDAGLTDRAFSIPKRVHRHLKTGDIVLFNRQPTLHRVSIMAHKVRVLPEDRTIRFHYANCNSYNADFDGDEMNVHVPQDYVAKAEAEQLMLSSRHYIVPTSGEPVRGLIQDHIAAATLISHRDRFFERGEFMQLLCCSTERLMARHGRQTNDYVMPFPTIFKPRALWTGKQLISSILHIIRDGRPGISLKAKSRAKNTIVGDESEVIFREGHLIRGIIDKSSLGSSKFGVVHAVQEAYGYDACNDFLNAMSRLCVFFLRSHGHTTGVGDLILQDRGERNRRKILSTKLADVGVSVANSVYKQMSQGRQGRERTAKSIPEARQMIEEIIRRDGAEAEDRLDTAMKTALNKVSSEVMTNCIPVALRKRFPENGFALMTNTGAKGSAVNAAQISCLLGSTVLEGKRVPRMGGSGATLPCFVPFDPSPNAGGFISSRFLTGISPQEFFFHAMSGREGLLDTSLKTANSGYLQRCLIKHMEGIRLHYDYTVRDSDNGVVQFVYGDDGIDPSKSRWLNDKVDWQIENQKCLAPKEEVDEESLFLDSSVMSDQSSTVLEHASPGALSKLGAVSEFFNNKIRNAEEMNNSPGSRSIRQFLEKRYRAAALQPGEAVGVVAAQGVGEPSTQMTLNTFHHAGSSSAHVTLGIPRLRELLMTASKYPKTPSMTLPVLPNEKSSAEKLSRRLQKIALTDLLIKIDVKEMGLNVAERGSHNLTVRDVQITLSFPEESVYELPLGFGFDAICHFVRNDFLQKFNEKIRAEVKRIAADVRISGRSIFSLYSRVAPKIDEEHYASGNGTKNSNRGTPSESDKTDEEENTEAVNEGTGIDDAEGEVSENPSGGESDDESMSGSDDDNPEEATRKDVKAMMDKQNEEENSDEDAEKTPKKVRKRKRSSETVPNTVANGNGATVEDDEYDGDVAAKMGYSHDSFTKSVNKQEVSFAWGLPLGLLGKLDIAEIAQNVASTSYLKEVKRVSRCFVEKDSKSNQWQVITEGSNIMAIFEHGLDLVDFTKLETNDMFGILRTYGVEALRAALINEFVKIFDSYGIPVNIRHLRLIADYMTLQGDYRGFNRISMDTTPSTVQQMTFETSVKFLINGAINGTVDDLKSPSASLALGQICKGGTGGFELLQKLA